MTRQNQGRDGWAFTACAGLGACLIIAAACAGGDTPPRDDAFEKKVQETFDPDYPDDATGAAGSVSMGTGGGGGQGGSASGGAGGGGSGSGAVGGGSSGASGAGSSGSGSTGPVCDAVAKVFSKCSFQPCHGDGSTRGEFADSLAAARALVDVETQNGCGKYIDSANPDASQIYVKVTDNPGQGCGTQMPFNADPLSQEDQDCIRSWVTQF